MNAVLITLFTLFIGSQTVSPRVEFEAATVKVSTSGAPGVDQMTPGRFRARNLTLRQLILVAFKLRDFQVSGGPGWLDTDRYDIEAKAETAGDADTILVMLQALLEDRFKLALHHATKEGPVYVLTVAKEGSKLKATDCTPEMLQQGPRARCGGISRGVDAANQTLTMRGVGMTNSSGLAYQSLTWQLSISLDRPVIDKTELTGMFDADLKWARDEMRGEMAGPSLFTAVQEQFGLKLEPGRGPMEVVIIDRAEKPVPNP